MRRTRPDPRPAWLAGAAVALVVVIFVLAPHYNDAQRASTAAAFRDAVGDDRGRFAAAAVVDVGFALTYAALAWSIARRLATRGGAVRLLALAAAAVVSGGAICDVLENLLVLRNIDRWSRIDDGTVEAMVQLGDRKWLLAAAGCLVALVAWLLARRQPANASS